ncbi:MAG: glycosyltransferase [Caldiserica bacterium]|jgi:UDP-D-galactose:(glucosyl)LPS alpha-1,6-D-galactosyltransferase|nr:glycosyltransferase [Caldisericota bacterium]
MHYVVYALNDYSAYGGEAKVLSILGNLLTKNGHHFRIVSLLPRGHIPKPIVNWLSSFPVSYYSLPKTSRPERLHWLSRIFWKRSILNAFEIVLDDFHRNGFPDYCIVCTDFEILPDLARAREREPSRNFKIVYWDHIKLPALHKMLKNCGFLNFYRKLSLELLSYAAKFSLRKADLHLAISSGIRELILKYDQKADVRMVYNPVPNISEKLVKKPNTPKFLYVGRLQDDHKNISFLLKGLSLLKSSDWQLSVIGTGPDELKLKELGNQLAIGHKINWLGFQNNPFEVVEECTALILTSRFEGFGLVLIEANAHGIPVISSNCLAGPDDVVIEGVNGYLYPEGDLNNFVNLLEKVIRGELSFASSEEIVETASRFSVENYYERLKVALEIQ